MQAEGEVEVEEYLQRSSSEMEKASSSRPMLMITVLVSGHTCDRSHKHDGQRSEQPVGLGYAEGNEGCR